MTDIIDLFLSPDNVERMNRLFGKCKELHPMSARTCGMRGHMHEFIYGPYVAGLYDIWTGTDADLYLRHMNDEFIKYMEIRHQRRVQMPCAEAHAPSARVETASYLNPYDHERERARRTEMAQPRRPVTRGTGASMGGARRGCQPRKYNSSNPRAGTLIDELYSRWNRDQAGAVHMTTRDDEASDVGHLDYIHKFAIVPGCTDAPFGFEESQVWLHDPVAGSGEAQHHLLVLDSQLSVLNQERTIPWGYGTTEEQLADDARIAARYHYRDCFGNSFGDAGVIPKTSYKKITGQIIDPMGRVTLDEDRKLATDIMSRDSKGFILSGRR